MSTIFPGNYVAHLNAYREQGVEALPGVEFYKVVGALVLNPDNKGLLTNGELPAGTYDVEILSPDMRQDDKPRKDKPCVIPAGSVIYRTAVSAPGVKEATVAGTTTIEVLPDGSDADSRAGDKSTPASPVLTFGADGYAPAEGAVSALKSVVDGITNFPSP